ncbi:MAG TPA: endopeptidase La [Aggregatilineales bacterium]|nr:endopeptidase La [Aggregatilineales bacterium]
MFGQGISDFYKVPEAKLDSEGLMTVALIPLRDMVVYPTMIAPLFVARDRSLAAITAAQGKNQTVIAVAQINNNLTEPTPDDLYLFGTEIALGRLMRMPDGATSVLAQGRRRVEVVEFLQTEPYFRVKARPVVEARIKNRETDALMRAVTTLFEKCVELNQNLPEEAYVYAMNVDEPGALADLIASTLDLNIEERQSILELIDPVERLQRISVVLGRELDMLQLEEQINSQVQQEVDRNQRELYLREQMRVIQSELGETDVFQQEVTELRTKIDAAQMPKDIQEKALKEISRLQMMPPMAPEVGIIRTYLDWLIDLPWTKATEDNLDINHAAKVLNEEHFGLPRAKDRILEHIAVRKLAPDKMRTPILCFVGPPGTGKTSLGRSIARALGREFVRVSLGGVRDEAEIRGHRRTYIGALPGRILQTIRRAGTVNPVFMLDEIDKLGQDFRGDPSSALLEVLDPEQNNAFSDHYLEVAYDLSRVMFITTANLLDPVPPALLDRLEVIEFAGYSEEEKLSIAKRFLVPRQLEQHGLKEKGLRFDDPALQVMIREYTYEAGVRNLEREIANVCRKVARRVAGDKPFKHHVTSESLLRYLGPPHYLQSKLEESDQVGIATGLAWTEYGGDIMPIEVTLMPGKGGLMLTGQLGEVMQESAQAALSYTRSRAKALGLKENIFEKTDIHLHVPEGAVPKDGPSAGITLATALISAFTQRKIYKTVAMTGEITLRGRVLAVGGIREKLLAAHRAGIKKVFVPARNQKDITELPKKVLRELQIVYVEGMEEVLQGALAAEKAAPSRTPRKPKPPTPPSTTRRSRRPAATGDVPGIATSQA